MKLNEIIPKWQFEKKHFVKKSTMSAYSLLLQNLPVCGSLFHVMYLNHCPVDNF